MRHLTAGSGIRGLFQTAAVILGARRVVYQRCRAAAHATMIDIAAVRKRRQLDIETQSYLDGARWLRNM
jgi:hypothetical protein